MVSATDQFLKAFPNVHVEGFSPEQLDRCFGHIDVRPEGATPRYWTYEDVVVAPYRAGLYDLSGNRLEGTSPYYTAPDVTMADGDRQKHDAVAETVSPAHIPLEEIFAEYGEPQPIDGDCLFLGNYNVHFGHWLTDNTNRLWAHAERPADLARAFIPFYGADAHRGRMHMDGILAPLGLAGRPSDRPRRTRLLRRVIVPEPALQIRYRIFRNAADAHMRVARHLLEDQPPPAAARPVYLSRSALPEAARSVQDEPSVEALFSAGGFEIVHPETLSFTQQVAMFNSAPVIAGFAGSAFHTGMLSLKAYRGTLLILSGDDPVNGRLVLQGSIKNYRSVFVWAYRYLKHERVVIPDLDAIAGHLRALDL